MHRPTLFPLFFQLQKYGAFDELYVYYHPITKKHLGLARVVFESVKGAKLCVDKLNNTPVMGKTLSVFTDMFGERCKSMYEDLTVERKPEPPKVEEKIPEIPIKTVIPRGNSSVRFTESYVEKGAPAVVPRHMARPE